jgi:hypothetical protein
VAQVVVAMLMGLQLQVVVEVLEDYALLLPQQVVVEALKLLYL